MKQALQYLTFKYQWIERITKLLKEDRQAYRKKQMFEKAETTQMAE